MFATALNNLGAIQQLMGKLFCAEQLFQRALAIRESGSGLDHPDLAPSLAISHCFNIF